ncbi:MAG: FAD-dependent oxidoreductase [Methyloprofundus sp.]|nr:FAD-dependent oxidoreductase [Methyloprofundus sp.]
MNIIIIGSGIAGVTFAEKLRQLSDANITLLTTETHGYYSRPMLSRGFSNEEIETAIIIKPFDALREQPMQIIENVTVTAIDRDKRCVYVFDQQDNKTLSYDQLIIATGSSAFIPPPFLAYQKHFCLFNSLSDLIQLRAARATLLQNKQVPEWAIIGGGLIGCEIASDLAVAGDKVSVFHAMDRLMERQLIEQDSAALLAVMQGHAVDVKFNQPIESMTAVKDKVCIKVAGEDFIFNKVIVACGFKPRIELAKEAGLETNRGIRVNSYLQTSDEHIYALGDVAELPDNKLYAYVLPIRKQALWLAGFLSGQETQEWQVPEFNPKAKVHGFVAAHPYTF